MDPLGEHADAGATRVVHGFEEAAAALIETQRHPEFRIVFRPDIETADEESRAEFNELLRVIYYRGNVLLQVEEVQLFCSPHFMPHWMEKCLLMGRHRNVACLFTTQRPGLCHKTIVAQAGHVFCGSLHEKNDVDYTRSILAERAFELMDLPERQFLYFQPGKPLQKITNDLKNIDAAADPPSE